ncbi:RimJ/RimL family protein N-acetyltransferase [Inhella inkyongensis]|uniref:RimJ/RimL family protein N-acetyltransferase n=1 Tax=Inhella inkyongensis TaxID=392593 RepID=A0A840S2F3_9BURK|nr:GNAT family N-acetyltransferase [Inhella inkyongensis]MBB5205367.1 RimJ/RimL family protein N-acetyltransferase [Inhella inkyongensis]
MNTPVVLETPRLRLEPFAPAHLQALNAMNGLPEVYRYLSGSPETLQQTQTVIERVQARWQQWGCSWWSLMARDTNELVGAGCVQYLGQDPANPLELGWRLHPKAWGRGLASEAARHMADWAFDHFERDALCAVCHPDNQASRAVMQRLGMHYIGEQAWYDISCAVYELRRSDWAAARHSR